MRCARNARDHPQCRRYFGVTVTVTLKIGGQSLVADLDDRALTAIAERAGELVAARYFSRAALATHYGVSERTIRTWRERGLPGVRCGREVMYPVAECDAWIRRQA
jgi:hypothetical protein